VHSRVNVARSGGPPEDLRDLACVVHVHSTYSDGTATVGEILATARAAGVDAVLLTDHDTLQARRDGWEGRHDGVLLVVGHEVTSAEGHLLVFGVEREIPHAGRTAAELCADAAAAGGLAIAAHPFSLGSRISRRIGRPHPWGALEAPGCGVVELWSLATDEAESWRGPRSALRGLRAPEGIDGPPARHLELWDALCARRPTVAVGGLDAHQPGVRVRGRVRSPMPHARWFGLLRTHVLVAGEPTPAALLEAIRAGRCYLALDHLGDARGFRLSAGDVPMGGQAPWRGQTLRASVPLDAALVVLHDGAIVASAHGRAVEHQASAPGVYRVEAWGGNRRWIVSNPVYLR
jgi:hypothetical protein